jgi:hypothetical protein
MLWEFEEGIQKCLCQVKGIDDEGGIVRVST